MSGQTLYNYYRDYDPSTGRYIESDPIGLEGGINTYGYVGGNPLSWVDPEGLKYYPESSPWNGDVIIERGAKITGWIVDLPGDTVDSGCSGAEDIPYPADIDFIRVNGKWYKIKGGTATVGGSSIYGGRSDVAGPLTYPIDNPLMGKGLVDGGTKEYKKHIKDYFKCECSAK